MVYHYVAFFIYESSTEGNPAQISHISDIECNLSCKEGEHVGLNSNNTSECLPCPENTYSTGGKVTYMNTQDYPSFLSLSTQYCKANLLDVGEPCSKWVATKDGIETSTNISNISTITLSHTVFMELEGKVYIFYSDIILL